MEEKKQILTVILCVVFLLALAIYRKAEWLMNLLLRGILGTLGIYFVNVFLQNKGISLGIGINEVSVLTVSILGFPGFLALYALGFYRLL